MTRSSLMWAMLAFALFFSSGCSPTSMATRAITEIKGASSEVREIPGTVKGRFDRFKGADISPPRNELGGLVPTQFTSTLRTMLREFLVEEEEAPFRGDSPKLTIEPQMQWFSEASSMSRLVGSDSYVVVLFKLSADGVELGKLEVATKSGATRTDSSAMAKSMAKELAEWFEERQEANSKQ